MGKRKVTSSDVAKRAGVSQATVSMVLNKKYNVSFSKEVIRNVEEAARELGYEIPKRRKRREERRENMLVVISPNLTNPYYVMLLQGLESRAADQGFGIFVCNTQRDLKLEERYLKMISSLNPQGIIYMCNPSQCFMAQVDELSNRIPVVVINNQNEPLNVDAVELDNSKLGRLMARHLLELGHRDVGYIAPPLTVRQKQRSKRVEGFLKEFQNAGLKEHVVIKAADEQIDKDVPGIDSEYRIGYARNGWKCRTCIAFRHYDSFGRFRKRCRHSLSQRRRAGRGLGNSVRRGYSACRGVLGGVRRCCQVYEIRTHFSLPRVHSLTRLADRPF